jgi:drug/metabolite transporter (DMT)-like permease
MRQARSERAAPEWQIWLALGTIYLVWGSTYLAIRVVVETMPPLLSAGVRHTVAALLIFGFLALRRGPGALRLRRSEWLGGGFVGLALLLGGNGLVMIGEQDVPSGLAALIVGIVPLFVVVLRTIFGERIGWGTVLGVVVGFVGVAVLVVPRGVGGSVEFVGTLLLILAAASWSFGSYFSKRLDLPVDPLASTGVQMLVGGTGLLLVGAVTGEAALVQPARFSFSSLLALVYLVVVGSVIGYTAYTWALAHAPVSRVATYAYVNPVVAIILGFLILDEPIDLTVLVGAVLIVVSVGLVIRTEARTRPARETLAEVATGAADGAPEAGTGFREPSRGSD